MQTLLDNAQESTSSSAGMVPALFVIIKQAWF